MRIVLYTGTAPVRECATFVLRENYTGTVPVATHKYL
jgi:hypothetical protein